LYKSWNYSGKNGKRFGNLPILNIFNLLVNSPALIRALLKVADLPPLLLSILFLKLKSKNLADNKDKANLTFSQISFILDVEETTIYVFHLL
jgi:hypothetical protein